MAYAEKVVSLFAAGSIPNLPTGLMIGRLLADLTNSSPVRISKRIPGDRARLRVCESFGRTRLRVAVVV